ncbi:hypothetical protein HZ994_06485 [Akkermansiaceae bacterium]|nr:hypothetical protein HZ994_06485 [Akkermansiaceae bacterium]
MIPLPGPEHGVIFAENLRNLLHVPLFAFVTLLLRFLQLSLPPRYRSPSVCVLAALLLAVASEVAQGFTGRNPAWGDFLADCGGILLGCVILPQGRSRRSAVARLAFLSAGCGMMLFAARPLLAEMQAAGEKREAFPQLWVAGSADGLWQAQGGTRLRVSGSGGGLDVQMAGGSYEGLRYTVPGGVVTEGFAGLLIEAENRGSPFELGIRMDGAGGSRWRGSVAVPRGRSEQLARWSAEPWDGRLVRVVLHTGEAQPARAFRLLGVRLLRETEAIVPDGP